MRQVRRENQKEEEHTWKREKGHIAVTVAVVLMLHSVPQKYHFHLVCKQQRQER